MLSWFHGMTPEERFEHIEQAIVQIVDIQREQADIQREQAEVQRQQARIQKDQAQAILGVTEKLNTLTEVQQDQARAILEVTEKLDALIDVVDKLVKRNGH